MPLPTEPCIDLVWGAEDIGKMIKQSARQTFHMLENGLLPAKKVGSRWVADRRTLAEFFLRETAA